MRNWLILLAIAFAQIAHAQGLCSLVGAEIYAQDKPVGRGTYLGLITDNRYASESIINPYGPHGSKYASESILNQYGNFGSRYSLTSAYNPYTNTPPLIVNGSGVVANLTKNTSMPNRVDPDALLNAMSQGCGGIYNPPVRTKPDLIVDSLIAIISKNKDSLYFGYIVANIGAVVSPAFQVGIAVNGKAVGPINFPAIQPGYYEYDIRGYKLDKDTTHILIIADYLETISEEAKGNNIGFGSFLTPLQNATLARRPAPRPESLRKLARFNLLGRAIR